MKSEFEFNFKIKLKKYQMKVLFEKQKLRGGIIDLNEKNQIINISVIS